MKELILCSLLLPLFVACNNDDDSTKEISIADTLELAYKECSMKTDQYTICFDSVLSDSRCPANANCIWQGEAVVKLNVSIADDDQSVELSTLNKDKTINSLHISLIEVSPYPFSTDAIPKEEYGLKLYVSGTIPK